MQEGVVVVVVMVVVAVDDIEMRGSKEELEEGAKCFFLRTQT